LQNDQQQQQIAVCKAKYKHQVDEYVQKLTGSSLKASDANVIDVATAAPNPEKMKPSERLQYQQERLLADIDELAEATISIPINADVLYGDNWRQKVIEYKKNKQFIAAVQVASVTGAIAGVVLFVAAITCAFFRIIAAGIGWVVKATSGNGRQPQQPDNSSKPIPQERIAPPVVTAVTNSPVPLAKPAGPTAEEFRKQLMMQTENLKVAVDQLKNLTGILQQQAAEHDYTLAKRLEKGFKIQHASFKHENDLLKKVADDIQKAVESQSDEFSAAIRNETGKSKEIIEVAQKETAEFFNTGLDTIRRQIEELNTAIAASASQQAQPVDISTQLEKAFNQQNELLKNQIEPLKNKPAAPIASDAVSKNLADLTEQVCAIREYAAKQQQRLAKLQDGYDWNIIKNFCLRVIRCIDNLDDRIGELSANGGITDHLLPVREELVFILESNGIERFGAKIDSDYRGQENRMQVLNEREDTEDTELIGRIAQVIRPGYQCRVNDDYTKIVRPAQVRLYGSPCLSDVAARGS
jgi:hypothetical protein